jgi:uncharacterized protein YdhG (YjbR/CyaY superfamily)
LGELRRVILEIIPDAEQGLSYGVPAFRFRHKTIAGFAAFKNHLSYLPHSGSVFPELAEVLADYSKSSGALHFGIDAPLPREVVEQLIAVRIRQAFPAGSEAQQSLSIGPGPIQSGALPPSPSPSSKRSTPRCG